VEHKGGGEGNIRKMKENGKPEGVSRKRKNYIWKGNKKKGTMEINKERLAAGAEDG
jgi:hypothetical protein